LQWFRSAFFPQGGSIYGRFWITLVGRFWINSRGRSQRDGMALLLMLEQEKGVKSVGHRFSNLLNCSNLEELLDARNYSILAHGLKPMNRGKYRELLENALDIMNLKESQLMSFPEFPI
jgi:hypothetical protein